jgi:hypothetical protein
MVDPVRRRLLIWFFLLASKVRNAVEAVCEVCFLVIYTFLMKATCGELEWQQDFLLLFLRARDR